MEYPREFVDAVKAQYPDWEDLHRALDAGNPFVGRYLDDASCGGFSPEKVATMIDAGQGGRLKVEARIQHQKRGLYQWWCEIAQQQQG